MTELVVVGDGAAAAAAVIAAGRAGARVVRVAPPRSGPKRLGESLSPSARPVLERLGLWGAFARAGHRPNHTTFSAWATTQLVPRSAIASARGPGWVLDRRAFDEAARVAAAPYVVDRVEARVVGAMQAGRGVTLELDTGASIEARFVVDASGRRAAVGRRLGTLRRHRRLAAAVAVLDSVDPGVQPTPGILVEARPTGWWYSALLPSGGLAVAFFTDPHTLPADVARTQDAWRGCLAEAPYTARRVETAGFAPAGPAQVVDAGDQSLERPGGPGWAAVGDAAFACDPLASHGITAALWGGERAGAAAATGSPLGAYVEALAGGERRYREELRRAYRQAAAFADEPFWRARAEG